MYSTAGSRYTLPRTTSYASSSRYSSAISSCLPPVSTRYTPSRYSSYSTSTISIPRHSTYTPSTRFSTSSTYSKPTTDSDSWRSTAASPSLHRKSSTTVLSRRPSYSNISDLGYRSGSVSSLSTSSVDTYRSGSTSSSYVSSSANYNDDTSDVWVPRSRRLSSISRATPTRDPEPSTSSFTSSYKSTPSAQTETSKLAGRVGLHNLGNTCFMNAVLQCLCHTKPLIDYCMRGSFSSDLNHKSPTGGDLIKAFASLINILWRDGTNNVSPDRLKRELQRYAPRFSGYNQQDAQELLRYLLQGLHEEINRVTTKTQYRSYNTEYSSESLHASESWRRYKHTDDSKIVDLFCGQLKSTLTCTECGHVSVTFDPFWDLSLPIPEGSSRVTLQQCLNVFSAIEVLDGLEKPLCEKCKRKTRSTKQLMLVKCPVILVIHLKRFTSGQSWGGKLNVVVEGPKNLDISQFVTSYSSSSNSVYNLYGVVDHSGSLMSGHYTAKCKNPYGEDWNEFNDASVSSTSSENLVTSKAYLLFYEQARQGWSSRL